MKDNIHNYERKLERSLERIKNSKTMIRENKEFVNKFLAQLKLDNVKEARIARYLDLYFQFDGLLKKPFSEANKEDLKRIVGGLERVGGGKELSNSTKNLFKIFLRKLYRCVRDIDEKGVYPDEIKWITLTNEDKDKRLPEILTEEEIKLIIQNCTTLRNKALIAILAETGCRVSEIGTMKIKSVSFESVGAHVTVNGKTGMRQILVINCVPYLQDLINQHPDNTNPEAFLWFNSRSNLLSYQRISTILKQASKRAGIKKRIHPHLLRHTRATYLASFMSDGQLKKYMGWSSSRMIGIYTHLSGKDSDEAIFRANGLEVKKETKKPVMEPKKCLRCQEVNEATNICCKKCGLPLEKVEAERILKEDMKRDQADDVMSKLLNDPEVLELIKKKLSH